MEKQFMSVQALKESGAGRNWVDGSINALMLTPGDYTFGAIQIKTAVIDGKETKYPIIEVVGHGSISLTKVLANQVASETPAKALNKESFYFPQKPVNTLFTGDIATVAVNLQGLRVNLSTPEVKQQTGFPVAGTPWKSAKEATDNGKLANKVVYRVEKILSKIE
jgi:hypothetical protein